MPSTKRHARLLLGSVLVLMLALAAGLTAQSSGKKAVAPQNDEEFARLVKEWTTRPEFISPLVDHLPKVAGIPSPKDVLGHYVGEPKKLDLLGRLCTSTTARWPRNRRA